MKTLKIIKVVFTAAGVLMLSLALYLAQSTQRFVAQASRVNGTVIDLLPVRSDSGTTYKPRVHYVDLQGREQTLEPSSSSSPPSYEVGEAVTVLLSQAGDGEAKLEGFMSLWGGAVITGVLGGLFFLIGAGMMLYSRVKQGRAAKLRQHGQVVEAQIQGVAYNEALSVNGRNPYVVLCQWLNPQTQEVHLFQSENLWFDPSAHLKREQVRVFIEPGNPKRYLVDLSFLPKLAG